MQAETFKVTYEMVGGGHCTTGVIKSRKAADAKFALITGASDVDRAWLYRRTDRVWRVIEHAQGAGAEQAA